MALQTIDGGLLFPRIPEASGFISPSATNSDMLINASGEKVAFYIHTLPKAGDLSKVHFIPDAVTTAQDLKVSFQDIDLATGDPDGTVDQYKVVPSASVSANTWITTGIISSDGTDVGVKRTVSVGDSLYVVVEFDSTVGDLEIHGLASLTRGPFHLSNYTNHYTGSWAKSVARIPVFALEYSDGTIIHIHGVLPYTSKSGTAYNNGSTPDENALIFQVPFACQVNGFWMYTNPSGNAQWDVVLYDSDGSTPLGSVSVDEDQTHESSGAVGIYYFSAGAVTLSINTNYRLSLKPTSGTNVAPIIINVDSASIFDAWDGGQLCHLSTRTDAAAWSETTTSRLVCGVNMIAFDDGVGGGGGGFKQVGDGGGMAA